MAAQLYTNNVVLVIGAILLILLGYSLYKLFKKNPELDLGPALATGIIDKHETIFMTVIFLEYLAASIVAATLSPPESEGIEMSPLGRIIAHIVLSLTGTVAQFTLVRDISVMFTKQTPYEYIGNGLISLLILFTAMAIPYVNLLLMASSLGQSVEFTLWAQSHIPFVSDGAMARLYSSVGLPPNYQPWPHLSPTLHVFICTSFFVHYILPFIEAGRTMLSPKRRGLIFARIEKEKLPVNNAPAAPANNTPAPNTPSSTTSQSQLVEITSNATYALRRIGYTDNGKINNIAKMIQNAIVNNGGATQAERDTTAAGLALKLARFKLQAATLDNDRTTDQNTIRDKKKALKDEIKKFLSSPVKDAAGNYLPMAERGLGINLR